MNYLTEIAEFDLDAVTKALPRLEADEVTGVVLYFKEKQVSVFKQMDGWECRFKHRI